MNFLVQKFQKTTAASYLLCDHADLVRSKMHKMPPFTFMYIFSIDISALLPCPLCFLCFSNS